MFLPLAIHYLPDMRTVATLSFIQPDVYLQSPRFIAWMPARRFVLKPSPSVYSKPLRNAKRLHMILDGQVRNEEQYSNVKPVNNHNNVPTGRQAF